MTEAIGQSDNRYLRHCFLRVARFPAAAYFISLVMTVCMQSSSAMSSLLIDLVNTDLLPFSTAVVMLLGANVGSTLAVQLLSYHVTDYALYTVGLFALLALCTAHTPWRRVGQALFAFGLMLLGLFTLSQASQLLASSPWVVGILHTYASRPFLLFVLGILLATLLNSSTATIGLALALVSAHTLAPESALALMLGANVGTTLPTLLAARRATTRTGQRQALVHTGTKLIGACLLFLLLNPLAFLLACYWPNATMQVAIAHLGFNVLLTCVCVPLASPLAGVLSYLVPSPAGEQGTVRYVQESAG
jgi:phosphate:Na+ symporter